MACRKMNEDVAYACNTESGCKRAEKRQYSYLIIKEDNF